jgi:hypothetical protein
MKRALAAAVFACAAAASAQPIDRHALVTRHNVELAQVDPHAPLMVGNGDLAFTADITGLQTFPEQYSALAPLLTMAQWAWHSFPNPRGWSEEDGLVQVPVPGGGTQPYPWIRDWAELDGKPALVWLRENPHRFSLGRLSLVLDGQAPRFEQVTDVRQSLDLWNGILHSRFRLNGEPVTVDTLVDPARDTVVVAIGSPLVGAGRLGVDVRYPGVSATLNPDPSDFAHDERHRTTIIARRVDGLQVERRLDDTVLGSTILAPQAAISQVGPHHFRVLPIEGDHLHVGVSFDRGGVGDWPDIAGAAQRTASAWQDYWRGGGAIDFSGSTDPRAAELERRVVLSQYLARINEGGAIPPQEEGLFSNSWNGKFHLEVQPLHLAHFAAWGRPELLERNLGWYLTALPSAEQTARQHGVEGAWWTKMTGPEGRNSPSTINPFIMWQQPAPIYLAEMVWRARRDRATLDRYAELVEQTAKLLASWPRRDESGALVLGPPIVPVQENHPPLTTVNPAFEAEFFRYGLGVAQQWRERRGLSRNPEWDAVIAALAPPALADGLVLPAASERDFWRQTVACSGDATRQGCLNRDHPSMLMAYGLIAGRVDPEAMRHTLRAVERHWDLRQTWGWDFPVIAMTAARLGEREDAVDWLFRDLPNNRWGVSGMTPRVHLDTETRLVGPAAANGSAGPDGPGFRRAAETYFPSNGSLLLAVAMMAAGWDGSHGAAPGFPEHGWVVRTEGLNPVP